MTTWAINSAESSSADDSALAKGWTITRETGPTIAITRMRFRHFWMLCPALVRFRRLYGEARKDPAFIRGQVCVADPWTLVNVSIWRDRWSMFRWSGHPDHIDAVRWTYTRTAEVWSADWELNRVSRSAYRWHGQLALSPRTTAR